MRIAILFAAAATLTLLTSACANQTGNMTIAQWCAADPENRTNTGICNPQAAADAAMTRDVGCVTRTLMLTRVGACDPGYTLTSCTQTRYTHDAGGEAVLRSINDSECRFNDRVLEFEVRCCATGPNVPPATIVTDTAPHPIS